MTENCPASLTVYLMNLFVSSPGSPLYLFTYLDALCSCRHFSVRIGLTFTNFWSFALRTFFLALGKAYKSLRLSTLLRVPNKDLISDYLLTSFTILTRLTSDHHKYCFFSGHLDSLHHAVVTSLGDKPPQSCACSWIACKPVAQVF